MNFIKEIFDKEGWRSENFFIKHLTKNDDSGRHGVLIPQELYNFFPEIIINDAKDNAHTLFNINWKKNNVWEKKEAKFIYYQRYPERRITSLSSEKLNLETKRILIISKYNNNYRGHVILEDETVWMDFLKITNTYGKFEPGVSKILSTEIESDELEEERDELVTMLREVSAKGWIRTRRSGPTGIGFTLESELGIEANSYQAPDFKGIEIKSTRENSNVRFTLFSKTPTYDPMDRLQCLNNFGYLDNNNRTSLNITINYGSPNNQGWLLDYIQDKIETNEETINKLYALKDRQEVFYWLQKELKMKLDEKHNRCMFVYALKKGAGSNEEFFFKKAFYARRASITNFDKQLVHGNVSLDLVMHKKPNGTVRDHGFLFKIDRSYISSLFEEITEYNLLN